MNRHFGGTLGGGGRLLEAPLSGKGLEGPGKIDERVGRGPSRRAFRGRGMPLEGLVAKVQAPLKSLIIVEAGVVVVHCRSAQ